MIRFSAGLTLVAALLVAPSVSATTYLVRSDGSGDFPTIAAAISGATAGDTISLADGTFTGSANKNLDFVGKHLVVRSQSGVADACIIDCQGSGRGFIFQSGEDSTSVLELFTITRGLMEFGGAIYCRAGSGPRISGCIFRNHDRTGARGAAIACVENSHPRILGCLIRENRALSGSIVYTDSGSSPQIEECTFSQNIAAFGSGLRARESSPTVTRCLFSNQNGRSLYLESSSSVVNGCTFVNHSAGSALINNSTPQFTGCTFAFNTSSSADISVQSGSSGTFSNTIVAYNGIGRALACSGGSGVTMTCCDIVGNVGGDWTGCIADQEGMDGNFSADPLFCDAANGNYSLAENSPCSPDSNLVCGLVGASPVGCPPACTIALAPARIATYDRCEGSFRVDLSVDHVVELGSFNVCLGFRSAEVSFDQVVIDSGFLGSTGRAVVPTDPNPCAAACQTNGITFGAKTIGSQPGPSGTGRLASIFWRPTPIEAEALTTLCFDGSSFENTDTPPGTIPVAVSRGTELVHRKFCYGDFNDNGDVSIVEVMQVAARWGSHPGDGIYNELFDVNLIELGSYCASTPDGSIDVVDVQAVAARWGQGCAGDTPAAPPGEYSRSVVTASQPSTWLRIAPELLPFTGGIGDTAGFTLEAEDASALGAFQATLVFDPSIIQVEAVEPAEFLGSTGRSANTLEPLIDNESGVVTLGAWSVGDQPGPEGSGSLARVTVSLRSCPGSTGVAINHAVLTDPNGWPQSLAGVAGGTVVTECRNPSSTPFPASTSLKLLPSRPNPFARATTIPFVIPSSAGIGVPIDLLIVDVSGRNVRRLASGTLEPGYHEVTWDGRDDRGIATPGGVYFCQLRAGEMRLREQIILLD